MNGKEFALAELKKRRETRPKQVDNAALNAGMPMYYYCKSCGYLSDTLPESHLSRPKRLCVECKALDDLGCLS